MRQKVAILGLGTMGTGMAQNLLKAGFPVTAYNRTRAKAEALSSLGASVANTPSEAAQDADILLSMLADDRASRSIWSGENGALTTVRAGTIVIECSTVSPTWIAELAAAAASRGAKFLDAPVTGSKMQAEAGQLTFLVGGQEDTLSAAQPVLSAMSKEIVFLGPAGSGARMKLINNFLCGVQVASLAEGLAWIEQSGLDREKALSVLKNGAPGSPLLHGISARMTARSYNVNFLLRLMQKDLEYAHAEAEKSGIDLRTATIAGNLFGEAITAGYGDQDMSAVIELLRAEVKKTEAYQTRS